MNFFVSHVNEDPFRWTPSFLSRRHRRFSADDLHSLALHFDGVLSFFLDNLLRITSLPEEAPSRFQTGVLY